MKVYRERKRIKQEPDLEAASLQGLLSVMSCAGQSCLAPVVAWLLDLAGSEKQVFLSLKVNFAESPDQQSDCCLLCSAFPATLVPAGHNCVRRKNKMDAF